MTITDEQLSAYIDGELSDSEADIIRVALQNDKKTFARCERLRKPDRLIAAAYGQIDNEPMPAPLTAMLESGSRQFSERREKKRSGWNFGTRMDMVRPANILHQWSMPIAAAALITIAIGTIFVSFTRSPAPTSLLASTFEQGAPIYDVLETGPSAVVVRLDSSEGSSVMPVLSFKTKDQGFCREFIVVENRRRNRGVACREDKGWAVLLLASAGVEPSQNSYQTATEVTEASFEKAINELMVGEPLNSEEELMLMRDGWRE